MSALKILSAVLLCFSLQLAAKAAGLDIPENIQFDRGVEYANPDNQHLQLNIARPKNARGPLPCVLCIHGGGFRAGNRDGYNPLLLKLAGEGYVAVTVSYRLAPKYPFPAAIHDVKAAVRWLKANAATYQIDPDRIGVTGDSAGGHLAQFLGVTADVERFEGNEGNPEYSSGVACVVNRYGPSDFTKSYGKSVDAAEVLPLWLGGNLETARQNHILASPLNWVTPNAAPTLILHGTEDKYVAYEQAVWMRDRLKEAGVHVEMLTLEGAGHGFQGADAAKADAAMLAFFDRQLKEAHPELKPKAGKQSGSPAAAYQEHAVEGWRVMVSERLLTEEKAATEKALELLREQLREIVRVIPAHAVAKLRQVALWFSPEYPGTQPKAEYHPSAGWLRENDRDEAMAQSVEFTNIRIFEAETARMPNFTLHELAHAFHHRFLPGGFENEQIEAALRRAKSSGSYAKVERWNGTGKPNTRERAYAMVNPMEYFAETTEAFFTRNDFFPFTREELQQHDPAMEKLLASLWGTEHSQQSAAASGK